MFSVKTHSNSNFSHSDHVSLLTLSTNFTRVSQITLFPLRPSAPSSTRAQWEIEILQSASSWPDMPPELHVKEADFTWLLSIRWREYEGEQPQPNMFSLNPSKLINT